MIAKLLMEKSIMKTKLALSLFLALSPCIAVPASAQRYPDEGYYDDYGDDDEYRRDDRYEDRRYREREAEEDAPPVYWDEAPDEKQEWGGSLFRSVMMKRHNDARRAVGQRPLRWNTALAADAQRYANQLARTRVFQHSKEPRGRTPQGENLWRGSSGYFSYDEMIGSWVKEKRWFRRAAMPRVSSTGRWADVAHYTQIIWHSTTDVGCAIGDNGRDEYLVCRYGPPGNVYGRDPLGGDEPPKPVRTGY